MYDPDKFIQRFEKILLFLLLSNNCIYFSNRLRSKLQNLQDKFRQCMSKVYFNKTVDEWIKLRLDPLNSLLDKSLQTNHGETSKDDQEEQMAVDQPGIDDIE